MRNSRFAAAQIIAGIKEQEAALPASDLCRTHELTLCSSARIRRFPDHGHRLGRKNHLFRKNIRATLPSSRRTGGEYPPKPQDRAAALPLKDCTSAGKSGGLR